jgi:hypothetical protein
LAQIGSLINNQRDVLLASGKDAYLYYLGGKTTDFGQLFPGKRIVPAALNNAGQAVVTVIQPQGNQV